MIPNYLKHIACNERKRGDFSVFDIRCECGCMLFYAFESCLDMTEREACEPHYKALEQLYCSGRQYSHTVDSDGKVHYFLLSDTTKEPAEELIDPPAPFFSSISVFKIKCSECGAEYTLFDTRYNGWSGKYCKDLGEQEKNYVPHFRQKKFRDNKPFAVSVRVEHDPTFEDFQENAGEACSYEDYEDAFTWISIDATNAFGKKRHLFEYESD